MYAQTYARTHARTQERTHAHAHKHTHTHANAHAHARTHARTHRCRLMAKADMQECDHCGGHCNWDAESEWQEKWNEWDSKLAYYDRTYAPLLDEW